MHIHRPLQAALVAAVGIRAAAIAPRQTDSTTAEPCALISQTQGNHYDVDTALACLKSVPVDEAGDQAQVRGLQTMYQFQSDLSFLKDPTPGYLYPGVDVLNQLNLIYDAIDAKNYTNEYDVQLDLYNLDTSTYDFHTNYLPDILSVFWWVRDSSLVSLSTDELGLALPSVFSSLDEPALLGQRQDYTASPVVQIDGVETGDWLNTYGAMNPWGHDPDTNFNYAMDSVPNNIMTNNGYSTFRLSRRYQGRSTVLTFSNTSSLTIPHFAFVPVPDFSGVDNGMTFFNKFCSGRAASQVFSGNLSTAPLRRRDSSDIESPTEQEEPSEPSEPQVQTDPESTTNTTESPSQASTQNAYTPVPTQQAIDIPHYGHPVVAAHDKSISGFFPQERNDLAVLLVPTFEPNNTVEFENTLRSFLATSQAQGKTRLIIDLRGNGGGYVALGYDMFKQLFPDQTPYGAQTLAAFPLFDAVGQVVTDGAMKENLTSANLMYSVKDFDLQADLSINLRQYDKWSDFYGPQSIHGGSYTNIERLNLSDITSLGVPVYGYASDTQPQPQTFNAANITILSDGFCGSTCAVFAEFMKTQARVQAIAVGGRPKNAPMQWVGGSKGTNVIGMGALWYTVKSWYDRAPANLQTLFQDYTDNFANVSHALDRLTPGKSVYQNDAGRVNFKNNIRQGDSTQTPLQFVFEGADCRFFYTPAMYNQQSLVWERAYNIRWESGECVPGSAAPASSLSGSGDDSAGTGYINSPPPDSVNFTLPANATFSYKYNAPDSTSSSAPETSSSSTSGADATPTTSSNSESSSTSTADTETSATSTSSPDITSTSTTSDPNASPASTDVSETSTVDSDALSTSTSTPDATSVDTSAPDDSSTGAPTSDTAPTETSTPDTSPTETSTSDA